MDYAEAIEYLKEHNITKDDGTFYEFGEVSSEMICTDRLVQLAQFCIYEFLNKRQYLVKKNELFPLKSYFSSVRNAKPNFCL